MASILNQETAEADARLVRYTGDPARTAEALAADSGAILVRSWPYLAVNSATTGTIHSLVIALNSIATYTDPKADNVTYSGTFVNSKVEAIDENVDGSAERNGTIIQTLTRVLTAADHTALAALDPLISQENEILNFFEVNTGELDLISFTYKNLNPSNRTTLMGITDANLQSALANVVANYPASGWVYVDRKFVEEDNRTGTFSVLFRQTAFSGTAGEYARVTGDYGRMEASEMVAWPNVSGATATLIYNDAYTNRAAMNGSSYVPAPSAAHKLKYCERIPLGEGRYKVERVTFVPSSSGTTNWPPADDAWNVSFRKVKYRKYVEPYTGYTIDQKRIWTFTKSVKYTATQGAADSQLTTWDGTYNLEQGSGIFPAGNNLQWQAVGIWQTSDTGWTTDS